MERFSSGSFDDQFEIITGQKTIASHKFQCNVTGKTLIDQINNLICK